MLYQNYKNKLSVRLKFFEGIWRFRLFILIGLLLLIALILTLLGITGTVYGQSCAPSTNYGTPIAFEAKALFTWTETQYRKAGGGSWSETAPVQAGSYEVRAVSRSGFGAETYGKIFSYSILPLKTDVSVAEDEYVYGEQLTASAELAYRDRIAESEFSVHSVSGDRCEVDIERVTIENEHGEDVTFCYDLVPESARVSLVRRNISLQVDGARKVYDGTPLTAESYRLTSGSLVSGDELEIRFPVSVTEVGAAKNTPNYRIVNAEGEDVTDFYQIDWEIGMLTVAIRELELVCTSLPEKIYDGEPFSLSSLGVGANTPLAAGHRLQRVDRELVNVGTYQPSELVRIVDAEGNDVTINYHVYSLFSIEIEKRPIVVETSSRTWIHDGQPHSAAGKGDLLLADDTPYSLAAGERLSVDPSCLDDVTLTEITDSVTEVRYRDNALVCLITNARGEDVTDNYAIEYRYGQLRIKSEVIITIYPISKFYDAKPLSFEREDWSLVKPPDVEVRFSLPELIDHGSITLGELKSTMPVYILDKLTHVDVAAENRLRWEGEDRLEILTVQKRPITIKSIDISLVPDGSTIYGWENEEYYRISLGSLAEGHSSTVSVTGILRPGDPPTENIISSYSIHDQYGRDVTENYEVTLDPGILQWIEE